MSFEVYKFGGASVSTADGVRNLISILNKSTSKDIIIVVSAMGKITNALERVVASYFESKELCVEAIQPVIEYHFSLAEDLFENHATPVFKKLQRLFEELNGFLNRNKSPDYDFVYDQVVS